MKIRGRHGMKAHRLIPLNAGFKSRSLAVKASF